MGRDQLIAEFSSRLREPMLQWGRDQLIAEIISARLAESFRTRFNEAATKCYFMLARPSIFVLGRFKRFVLQVAKKERKLHS
jgi:hypothetical protein